MSDANTPKKDTVRIKLPPRHGTAADSNRRERDPIRIKLPPRARNSSSARSVTPKPPILPRPLPPQESTLPGLGQPPKPSSFPLPSIVESIPSPLHSPSISDDLAEAPLLPVPPTPPIPVAKAPGSSVIKIKPPPPPPARVAKAPTLSIVKTKPTPEPVPVEEEFPDARIRSTPSARLFEKDEAPVSSLLARAPLPDPVRVIGTPVAPSRPSPGPKKEMARILTMPQPRSSPPTVKISKTQPLITAPGSVRDILPISIEPPNVDNRVDAISASFSWALLAASALLFILQLWTYLS
jgi:hypothetical protein